MIIELNITKKIVLVFLSVIISTIGLYANEKISSKKMSCIQQSNYSGKTLDELKIILLEQAKKEAVNELYGESILSVTEIENGELKSDSIQAKTLGSIRLKGNPEYFNGKNFGEICANIESYITKKDLEKFKPKIINLERFCFNDPSVPMNEIKKEAKFSAYKEIISKVKPSLKVSGMEAESYIRNFEMKNEKFDFDTASYCFNATASIMPFELEMEPSVVNGTFKKAKIDEKNIIVKSGSGKTLDLEGKGTKEEPFIIKNVNQTISFNNNSEPIYYKIEIPNIQIVEINEVNDSVNTINLLRDDFSKIDYSSSGLKYTFEEETIILEIFSNSKSGVGKFYILFGEQLDFSTIPGYQGDIRTKNQTVRFKKTNYYNWFKLIIDKERYVDLYENKDTISRVTLLRSDLSKIDSWGDGFKMKLEPGTYIVGMSTNGKAGRASFNVVFGNDLDYSKVKGYQGDISPKNQTIKFKKTNYYNWFKLRLDNERQVSLFENNNSINRITLLRSDLSKIDSWGEGFNLKLKKGIYIIGISTIGEGNTSFDVKFD